MEIYRAVCEFNPPRGENDSIDDNILSFAKGDRFEVLDSNKRSIEWWGARALKDNSVGYVPSKYLKVSILLLIIYRNIKQPPA